MSRTSDPIGNRLARLRQAITLVKPDQTISITELAAAMGLSKVQAGTIVKETFDPAADADIIPQWGSEGLPFVMLAQGVMLRLIADCEARLAERQGKSELLASFAGIKTVERGDTAFTVAELRHIDAVQREAQRRKIEQGHYVLADEHRRIVSDICLTIQNDYTSVGPEIDAAGRWPEDIRKEIDEYFRNRAVAIHDRLQGLIGSGADSGEA